MFGDALSRRLAEDPEAKARHVVLTVNRRLHDKEAAWAIVEDQKSDFMEDMQNSYGPIRYVWVLSPQRSGYPHVHAIVVGRTYMPRSQLCAGWRRRVGGNAWVGLAYEVQGLARYLARHLGREVPEGVNRRWSSSRGRNSVLYEPFRARRTSEWADAVRSSDPPAVVAERYQKAGYNVTILG